MATGFVFTLNEDNSEMFLRACRQQRERAFEIIGVKAETYAKGKCPVDTGRLKNSITHEVNASIFVNTVTVGTDVKYGLYVEMGHRYPAGWHKEPYAPHPFIKPSIADHLGEYQSILERELKG